MKMPVPESSAITLTAAPRCSAGASSTISAVTTPATRTSKQTANSLRKARVAIEGAKPLAPEAVGKRGERQCAQGPHSEHRAEVGQRRRLGVELGGDRGQGEDQHRAFERRDHKGDAAPGEDDLLPAVELNHGG